MLNRSVAGMALGLLIVTLAGCQAVQKGETVTRYDKGQQPMMGQAPMALRCPTCMALAPMGTPYCAGCRTSLAGVVPTPANMPAQGQKSGVGGFLQSGAGQMAIGALGGAAAVIGGEMLLHGVEDVISDRVEENMEFGERHHHQRDKGLLGNLGHLADDIGLF